MKKLILLFVIAIPLISAGACVNKEVTETYYVAENRTEYYTTVENVAKTVSGENNLEPKKVEDSKSTTYVPPEPYYSTFYSNPNPAQHMGHNQVSLTRRITFEIPNHDTNLLELDFSPGVTTTVILFGCDKYSTTWTAKCGTQQTVEKWPISTVFKIPNPEPQFVMELHYSYTVPEWYPLTSNVETKVAGLKAKLIWTDIIGTENKEVTKERQVPVQVEKQRTIVKNVPFWEAIFR